MNASNVSLKKRKPKSKSALLYSIINLFPYPACLINSKGKILESNKSFQRLLNLSANKLIGKNFADLFAEDSKKNKNFLAAKLNSGSKKKFKADIGGQNANWVISPLKEKTKNYFLIHTDELQSKALSKRSAKQQNASVNNPANIKAVPAMVWITDENKNCTFVNQQWLNFTGGKFEEEIAGGWTKKVHPADYPMCLKTFNDAFDAKHEFTLLYRLKHADGKYRWIQDNGVPIFNRRKIFKGYVGSCTDITELKNVQNKLTEKNFYEDSIFNSINDAVFIHDAKNYKIIDVNTAACKMYGYTKTELLKSNVNDLSKGAPPYSQAEAIEILEKTKSETSVVAEWLAKPKSGKIFWAEINAHYSKIGLKERFIVSVRDISSRKFVEEQLRESETKFDLIIESTDDGILAVDNYGKVIKANKRFVELWKIPEEIMQSNDDNKMLDFVLSQLINPQQFVDKVNQLYRSQNEDLDIIIFKDGRTFERFSKPFIQDGNVFGRVWSFRDITKRVQIENALRENETKYRELVNNSPDAIAIYADGKIEFVNNECIRLMRATSKMDLLNQSVFRFIHPESKEVVLQRVKKFTRVGLVLPPAEEKFIRLDGSVVEVEVKAMSITYIGKLAVQLIIRDITERRKAERDLNLADIKFRSLFENANDSILLMTEDTFIECNQKTELLFGCSREDILNKKPYEFSPEFQPDQRQSKEKAIEKINAALNGTPQLFEWVHRKIDGTLFNAEVSLNRIDIDNKLMIQAIVRDISERKVAEEALRQSEEKYRLLIENAQDMVVTLDNQGYLKYISPSAKAFSGYNAEEELGKHFSVYFVKEEHLKEALKALSEIARTKKPSVLEFLYRPKIGEPFWVEVVSKPIVVDGNVTEIHSIVRNIQRRKKAQEALLEEQSLLKNIIENIPIPIYVKDLKGRKILANLPEAKFAGKETVEEILGKTNFELYSFEAAEKSKLEELQILNTGESIRNKETNWVDKDGKVKWYISNKILLKDNGNNPFGILGVSFEITDRKNAEELLKQSEESYHGLFNSVGEAIYIQDQRGIFVDVNQGAVKMYGFPREYFIGKNPADLSVEGLNDINDVILKVKQAFGGKPQQFEFWAKNSKGQNFLKEVRLTKGRYFGKDVLIATATDITERKKYEEKIKTALAEKEVLLKEVHHRVKNNLQAIIFLIEMQSESISDISTKQFLMELQERARTMSLVYERLYQSEFLSSVEMQPFLDALITNILHSFAAEKIITTVVNANNVMLDVEAAMPCGLIVNELFTNIIKYAFADKTIQDCRAEITMTLENDICKLVVKDNGIGLPENFDVTSADSLGLKLVNLWAVYQLNGKIEVSRELGASFIISFPTNRSNNER